MLLQGGGAEAVEGGGVVDGGAGERVAVTTGGGDADRAAAAVERQGEAGGDGPDARLMGGLAAAGKAGERSGRDAAGEESGRDAEIAFGSALLAGRTELPLPAAGAEGSVLDLIGRGEGVPAPRAPGGRCLSVAGDGLPRASADEPGGRVVQETFRFEAHCGGHLLLRFGTGGATSLSPPRA
ncbi:hypothetical protein ACI2LJ_16745 [Streptomyces sp. NPDC088090]|uniref:hypothetical protein n=1 Tax=Streptomyces sp. NPDC088090 TaxID=3365822 RepID=UPI00384E0334